MHDCGVLNRLRKMLHERTPSGVRFVLGSATRAHRQQAGMAHFKRGSMSANPFAPPNADTPRGELQAACKHAPGVLRPVIDPNRCEGKSACVAVCPYDVFIVRKFERSELPTLSLLGTLKWWAHGGLQADAVHADQCHGCGLCVSACPESAITLRRVG